MSQKDTAGRPARLVPAVRGRDAAGRPGGGGTAAGGRGRAPGSTMPAPGLSGTYRSAAVPPPPVRPAELATADAAELLSGYLRAWAADFLRSLRLHGQSVGSAETATAAADAVRQLRRAARRLCGTLDTFRPLLDGVWADKLAVELRWLSGMLSREYGHAVRLELLHAALHRLAGEAGGEGDGGSGSAAGNGSERGSGSTSTGGTSRGSGQDPLMPAGSARAGALLERQLTLARTRAHSAALQALVSARFHAVADAVAVLSYEVPLAPRAEQSTAAQSTAAQSTPAQSSAPLSRARTLLVPQADSARARLVQAVGELPLSRGEGLYHVESYARPVTARSSRMRQDAGWHELRRLLRLHRYAEEVLLRAAAPSESETDIVPPDPALASASRALDRYRDAVQAAEAAAAAARTPRIAPATAYALGVLHADQRQEAEEARITFGQLWHQSTSHVL